MWLNAFLPLLDRRMVDFQLVDREGNNALKGAMGVLHQYTNCICVCVTYVIFNFLIQFTITLIRFLKINKYLPSSIRQLLIASEEVVHKKTSLRSR